MGITGRGGNPARLFGASNALGYLACRLAESGIAVEWHRSPALERLRPVRLGQDSITLLKDLFRRHQTPVFFLEQAPEMDRWGCPTGPQYNFVFGRLFGAPDRLADSVELGTRLDGLARKLGVEIKESAHQVLPFGDGPGSELDGTSWRVLDLDPDQVAHGRERLFPHPRPRLKVECVELQWPQGRGEVSACPAQFMRLEGCLAFCEAHPSGGFVLSLISTSTYALSRGLNAIRDPKGSAPIAWRALALLNPNAVERRSTLSVGRSGFFLPGTFGLGKAFGRPSPVSNLETEESLLQAERLYERLAVVPRMGQLIAEAEDWREQEASRFFKGLKRAQFSEKMLFSERFQGFVLSASQILPLRLRHSLKSPV
jgi:hypothetical protein